MRLKVFLFTLFLFVLNCPKVFSQSNATGLYERAQTFIKSGDYSNAIILLKKSLELQPQSALYRQSLAYAYSLNHDYNEAEKLIKTVLRSNAANEQTYQIAGNIYRAQNNLKKAERNYRNGLKQLPNSGVLYSELGQVYYDERKYTNALQNWVEGIKIAPDYAPNYYFAARTYYFSQDKFWTIIYGEIFINLERYTNRTSEMKKMLLEAYKSVINNSITLSLTSADHSSGKKEEEGFSTLDKPDFKTAVLSTLGKSAEMAINRGVTPETLVMARTQFLLNWNNFYKLVYPYALFNYYSLLLKNGLFEAYNQWVFGPAASPSAYKGWVKRNETVMHQLIDFLNNHSLKPAPDQFYQKGKVEFNSAALTK